jgi:hypothetical protein
LNTILILNFQLSTLNPFLYSPLLPFLLDIFFLSPFCCFPIQ